MNHKQAETDLLASLVGDLAPVRPVRLTHTIATVLVVQAAAILAAAVATGAAVRGVERFSDPVFLVLLAILVVAAVLSVAATSRLAIPGRVVDARVRVALFLLPVALAVLLAVTSPWGGTWSGLSAVLVEGLGCTRATILVATPAWLGGIAVLRRLAPLEPLAVGLFNASAALFGSALVVQMACEACDSWHLALSHYAPVLLAAWLGGLLSVPLLRSR